jgi:opacity protein-like surface antigen
MPLQLGDRRTARRAEALIALLLVSPPALAAPPYRTDDPEPTDYRHFELYLHSTGTHVSDDTNGLTPAVEFDYGILPNTQLSIITPMAFDRPVGGPLNFGYGDSEVGVKYRLIEQDKEGWRPSIALFPTLDFRTGDVHRGLGTGGTRKFLPIWLQKDIGDWTINIGGGYSLLSGLGNKNYWFVGGLLQRKIIDQLRIGAEMFHQTAMEVGGKDSTGFNFGGIYDFTEHYHIVFSFGRGIRHAKETNEFSWYVALYVTGGGEEPAQEQRHYLDRTEEFRSSEDDRVAQDQQPSAADTSSHNRKAQPDKKSSRDDKGDKSRGDKSASEATPSQKGAGDVSAPFSWSGFYVGADLGYARQKANEADAFNYAGPFLSHYSLKGPIGGPFAGFNWQTGPVVCGLESDAEAAGVRGRQKGMLLGMSLRHDARGSIRGRAGLAFDRALFYGTGGVAIANLFPFALGEPFNRAHIGWTAGAGLEYAFDANWSGRVEYRRSDFGSATYASSDFDGNFYRIRLTDNAVRIGIMYHFNYSEAESAPAKN